MPITASSDHTFTYALFGWPKDLYNKILDVPIDWSIQGKKYSVSFSHKYKGTYEFGISVTKRIPFPLETHEWDFEMHIECFSEGQKYINTNTVAQPNPWWKGRFIRNPDENGFSILKFRVPQDMPLKQTINCTINPTKAAAEFIKHYGQSGNLYVKNATSK